MSYLEIVSGDIATRFAEVRVNGSAIETIADNQAQRDPQAVYATLSTNVDTHSRQTMGGITNRYRAVGDGNIDLFVPVNTGETLMMQMIDAITVQFLDVSTIVEQHSIRYRPAPSLVELPIRDGAHWRRALRIPFTVDYYA